jgi:hypothetical protein
MLMRAREAIPETLAESGTCTPARRRPGDVGVRVTRWLQETRRR